ncbi:hypothetical protein [Streptomyces sp. NPDC007856]|uniref:hypothetical protein n=1 Tax=Streptomyces sp. NPDC007856 TaxID=3364781 RepID=UPI003675CBE0
MYKRIASRIAASAAAAAVALGAAATLAPAAQAATPAARTAHTSPWLSGSELPLATTFRWKAEPKTRHTSTGPWQALYSCEFSSPEQLHVTSVTGMQFQGVDRHVQASQALFHFKDSATARKALSDIEHDYAGCAKHLNSGHPIDIDSGKPDHWTLTRTATRADGAAYRLVGRDSAGKPATAPDLSPDSQELFVQHGATISVLGLYALNGKIDNASGAASALRAMSYRLSHA